MTKIYDFAYSVALVRTLETMLLNENEVERMMLAPSATDAFKILNEFDYADNKAGIDSPSDFQKVITEGLMDIKKTLTKITPDKRMLNIILHQYDFHNIKTMIKAKISGKTYEDIKTLLSDMGAIPTEALKNYILEDITNTSFELTERTEKYIKKIIKKVQELFEKEKNPQVIDLYLDQKLMKIIYGITLDSKSDFLVQYVKKLIDINNIKLFFRMKSQEKPLQLYEMAFLWNGNVPYTSFKDAYSHGLGTFPELMKNTPYAKIIETGYRHYEEEKTFIYLEKEAENYLTNFIKRAKLTAFGPGPLIAYFLAKKNNALVIRMIMVNKLNNIDPEEIRSRLRELYS
ncbi:MAG: V-type ATPase subunit [Candidatus Peregrinibacteria bacterium]